MKEERTIIFINGFVLLSHEIGVISTIWETNSHCDFDKVCIPRDETIYLCIAQDPLTDLKKFNFVACSKMYPSLEMAGFLKINKYYKTPYYFMRAKKNPHDTQILRKTSQNQDFTKVIVQYTF